jgi:hypothetical protein
MLPEPVLHPKEFGVTLDVNFDFDVWTDFAQG